LQALRAAGWCGWSEQIAPLADARHALGGACYCPVHHPCHADVLLGELEKAERASP
jgi:hypothetical protein